MAFHRMRRVFGTGLVWAALWMALWGIVGVTIGLVDPDSIDPGEGWMMVVVFGPMGLLTGALFGALLSRAARGRHESELPASRVAGLGVLATAVVQIAYLGHGDQGLAANIAVALLISAVGGVVSLIWLFAARTWSHRHMPLAGPRST